MVDLKKLPPIVANMIEVISTRNTQTPLESILTSVNYSLSKLTTNLHVSMDLGDGVPINCNVFAFNFIKSGAGKDSVLNMIEEFYLSKFKENIYVAFEKRKVSVIDKRTMELIDEGYAEDELAEKLDEEFGGITKYIFDLSEGTIEGVKNLRETCEIFNIGASSIQIDELALNFGKSADIFTIALESYDRGNHKAKVTKSNKSSREVYGVSTNMLCYSSPAKIFDGGKLEEQLLGLYEQGLGRRSFYCFPEEYPEPSNDPKVRRQKMIESSKLLNEAKETICEDLGNLCVPKNFQKLLPVEDSAGDLIMDYQILNENKSKLIDKEVEQIELAHRHWKTIKLAGIYAFISGSDSITKEHVEQAMYVADLSGEAFNRMINQPPIYERMFEYMSSKKEVTDVDLEEQEWYKGNMKNKKDLINLTRAYGFRNDNVFRTREVEGVNFYSFVGVPKTNPEKITVSISKDITTGFKKQTVPFSDLYQVITHPDFKYSAGTFKGGHRNKENYEQKQNLIIIDIDDGMKYETAKAMFSDYNCLLATTKSHQKDKKGLVCDRFRIIFMTDRTIKLDSETYGNFMSNIYEFLGVPADKSCKDSSRFYYGAEGEYHYTGGERLLEISNLIPDTTKEKEYKVKRESRGISSMDNTEQYYIQQEEYGRNNSCNAYAWVLKLEGFDYETIETKVVDLNEKFLKPLTSKELSSTVLKSIKSKMED